MKITVRSAKQKDIESICLVHHAAVYALEGGPYKKDILEAWAAAVTPKVIQKGMDTSDIIGFVAEVEGTVIGFGAMHCDEIRAIYVHPNFQKKGVGSKLLARLETKAIENGFHHLNLNASLNARFFYKAHNYKVIKEVLFALTEKMSMESLKMEKDI